MRYSVWVEEGGGRTGREQGEEEEAEKKRCYFGRDEARSPPLFFLWRLSSSLNGHLPLLYPHPTPRIRLTQDGGGVDGGGGADTAVGGDAALL